MSNNWKDLDPNVKFELLSWMEEGLKISTKAAVQRLTYHVMIRDLEGKEDFDVSKIWDSVKEISKAHFLQHIEPYLEAIKCERSALLTIDEETIQPKKKIELVDEQPPEDDSDREVVDNGDD